VLRLDLALLMFKLTASLRLSDFLILELVADNRASDRTESATDRRSRSGRSYSSSDDRARAGSKHTADEGPFFTRR